MLTGLLSYRALVRKELIKKNIDHPNILFVFVKIK